MELSLTLDDGTVLTDITDLGLAKQWAEHENGPEDWAAMGANQQAVEIAGALAALRLEMQDHDDVPESPRKSQ